MKIAVMKERAAGETRIAATPEMVKKLINLGFKVYVEKNAGEKAFFCDQDYQNSGAIISSIPLEIFADADLVLGVQPLNSTDETFDLLSFLREGTSVIGLLSPFEQQSIITKYAEKKINCFSMEFLPRISRAQSMDVLSSQNNLAGYKAVIDAAYEYGKAFPMMMTAAGVVAPAKVLVLGAGVAGLQAIATAKRLGAIVTAFDVRAATKEQVESLGAKFIAVDEENSLDKNAVYAKEMSAEYKQKQQALIAHTISNQDIVISTALIPGKIAPILITAEMVPTMKQGSVIIDLGAANGGNCALSKKDKIVVINGVKIIGYSNFPARIPADASRLFARNIYNFLELLCDKNSKQINLKLDDEIIKASLITYEGKIVNKLLEGIYNNE